MHDSYGIPSVDFDCQSPQELLVSGSVGVDNDLPTSNELLQNLCSGYGYSIDLETISEVCGDRFLQEYSTKCGYQFTEDFFSVMNKYKIEFMDKVDSVIDSLSSSFSVFFKGLECSNRDVMCLINRSSSCFSRRVYSLRPKCINVLQSYIIPAIIKIISNSQVIDGSSERKMTYVEMERLFLYFVTILEKSIMGRMMKYWRDFCNENKIVFAEYSNPFACAYRFYRISVPKVDYPASFTIKFGECISFMAAAKIDEIVSCLVGKLGNELKKKIISKCNCICNYSDDVIFDLEKLLERSPDLIKKEFYKKIIEEGVKDKFSNFLKNILIWNKHGATEVNEVEVPIVEKIIDSARNLLVDRATGSTYKIINGVRQKLLLSEKNSLKGVKYLHAIEDRWGVKLHPEDDCRISCIKSSFIAKYKRIVTDKFYEMLKEGYKFLNGTIIDIVGWNTISEKLFPIAQDAVRHLVDEEYAELSKFLSEARILDTEHMFDGSSADTRKITSEEIDKILRVFSNSVYKRNRNLFRLVWNSLINTTKANISKSALGNFEGNQALDSTLLPLVEGGNLIFSIPSVQSKTINTWGLNLRPYDVRVISFIKRKFYIQIRDIIASLFSSMMKRVTILPSGKVLFCSSWSLISSELFEMATKSVESVVEKQLEELDRALSKARVVEVTEDYSRSFITRKITDNEKKLSMIRARKLVEKNVRNCTRSSWLRIVNKSLTDTGYGYKEKYKDISGMDTEGRWGVKLRYRDNTAILNARKGFSSRFKCILYNKFSSMLENKHEFDDGTFIGLFPWFRLYKKLLPIAIEEVKHILAEESKELEDIISEARAVVDSRSVRELTAEEKSVVLENVSKLVHSALKKLVKVVWNDLIISILSKGCSVNEVTSSAGVDADGKYDSPIVKLCYEDDITILNIKKKLSAEVCSCVSNKFSEMLKDKHKFMDGTTIDSHPWRKMSRKLLPIAKKEINLFLEKERIKISDILLKLHVDI
ncbi:hypothetical protein, partial [Candidatus Ichthyocystis hellenicum]|uniref:hypothetical protein n=1 Tax=Candidatus Ichthyocystis hellenicum TaxID=1561003 RepID=UPI001111BF9B